MPACATDDAFTPVWYACFALRLGVRLEQFKQLYVAHVLNHLFLIPDWTGCNLGFCRRSCWRARRSGWFSIFWINSRTLVALQRASQQNVVTLEFGSPCSPRSALFAHDLNRHDWQRVAPISHEMFRPQHWVSCFRDKNVFRNPLVIFGLLASARFRGARRGDHLSIRVRSYHDQLHGPIRFPQHLFSIHDHGRQRSDRGAQRTFLPFRWLDCTSSRLRAEEYDRPVTQSIATLEPYSRTIPTLDRTLVAR